MKALSDAIRLRALRLGPGMGGKGTSANAVAMFGLCSAKGYIKSYPMITTKLETIAGHSLFWSFWRNSFLVAVAITAGPHPHGTHLRAEMRVALLIGNGAYQHATQLRDPPNDASHVSAVLKRDGIDVTVATDRGKSASATAPVVLELKPGAEVRVIEGGDGWNLIARDGKELGYVEAKTLLTLQREGVFMWRCGLATDVYRVSEVDPLSANRSNRCSCAKR